MAFASRRQESACFAKRRAGEARGWNCDEWAHETDQAHLPERVKKAADVVTGGPVSRTVANTLGHVGAVLNLSPLLTLDLHRNPLKHRKEHKKVVADFERVRPQELSDTRVRLGGTNVIDDLKRTWTNRRTGPIGKILGTLAAPLGGALTPLTRAPHYNPWSDTVTQYADNKPITEHELGHAIDFNWQKPSDSFLRRQWQGTKRDLYGLAYSLPAVKLWHEAQANIESDKALKDIYKNDSEGYHREHAARLKVLPAGYGSYVGSLFGPTGTMIGIATGKGVGQAMAAQHAKRHLRDGDGDGKVEDGTQREHAAPHRKAARDLSPGTAARKHVAKKNFALPGKTPKGSSRSQAKGKYPVPDKAHARAAEGFCAMHHGRNSSECQTVRAKVRAKFGAVLGALVAERDLLTKLAADSTVATDTLTKLASKLGLTPAELVKRAYADPADFADLLTVAAGRALGRPAKSAGLASMFARAHHLSNGRNFKPGGKVNDPAQNSVFQGAPQALAKPPVRRQDALEGPGSGGENALHGHSGRNPRHGHHTSDLFDGRGGFAMMAQQANPQGGKAASLSVVLGRKAACGRSDGRDLVARFKAACTEGKPKYKIETRRELYAGGKDMGKALHAMSR